MYPSFSYPIAKEKRQSKQEHLLTIFQDTLTVKIKAALSNQQKTDQSSEDTRSLKYTLKHFRLNKILSKVFSFSEITTLYNAL